MRKIAWRSVRNHVGQFLFTALAVALAVTYLSGTLALRSALTSAASSATAATLKADLYVSGQVVPGTAGRNGVVTQSIDSGLAETISRMDGVAAANPFSKATVTLLGTDGEPVDLAGTTTTAVPLYDRGQTLVRGSRPAGRDQVALDTHTLERSGLSIGDTTIIVLNGAASDVTIVGEFSYGSQTPGTAYVGLDPEWIMQAVADDGKVSSVAVYLDDGVSAQSVIDQISPVLGPGVHVLTRAQAIGEQNAVQDAFLGYVQTFILVFVILAMCMGAFIIMTTFATNVRQRQNEFALLRAIGVPPSSILGIILAQALVIGLVGSVIGVGLGTALVNGIMTYLRGSGLALPTGAWIMSLPVAAISVAAGTALTLLGSLLPARRAALIAPIDAMRETSGARDGTPRAYGYAGALLIALGSAGVIAPWLSQEMPQRVVVFSAGASVLVAGLVVVSPALIRPAMILLGVPLRIIRPGGHLAVRSLNAFSRRTAATAATLLVGMTLVFAGTTVANSMHESIHESVHESMYADLVVHQRDTSTELSSIPEDTVRRISELEGVESTSSVAAYLATVTSPSGSSVTEYMAVVDPAHFTEYYDPDVIDGSLSTLDATHVAAFTSTGLKVGDRTTITGPNGTVNATVSALADNGAAVTGRLIVSPELAAATGSWTGGSSDPGTVLAEPVALYITAGPDADPHEVASGVERIISSAYTFEVVEPHELSVTIGRQTNDMLTVLYVLLALSIVIAVLGVINTLVLSVAERTREIGLMRAVGLGRTQLVGQIICESVLTAVYGTVLGGTTGIALAAMLRSILAEQGVTMLVIPWGRLLVVFLLTCLVGTVTALWPALRATRLPVLEAITAD